MRLKLLAACLIATLAGAPTAAPAADELVRGEYLTRAGNCAGCHTAPGGKPFAGGRAVTSAFGTFHAPNITPDPDTGIGGWSQEQFWRALHEGRRADGAALYPACPYPNFTRVRREDVDAIYAYLRAQPAVRQANRPHDLSFPASSRSLLSLWQWWYFEPGELRPDPARSAQWNRGAYLVEGLGHCSACHVERGRFGAEGPADSARGSRVRDWYAPSLRSSAEAGLQTWSVEDAAALLRHGKAGHASTLGPMADVVFDSLQYLSEADALAMAEYLRSLPDLPPPRDSLAGQRSRALAEQGHQVYQDRCQDCHGADGEGSVAAPALAGNRAVTARDTTNLRQIIRDGGYPPSTAGNPRPFGMPPNYDLSARQIDAVIAYMRQAWGNEAR